MEVAKTFLLLRRSLPSVLVAIPKDKSIDYQEVCMISIVSVSLIFPMFRRCSLLGTERIINTKSTTVVDDIIDELCNVIGVESINEKEEFSLYCIVEGETFTVPLSKDHYILDVTTELQRDGAIYYLIFCRYANKVLNTYIPECTYQILLLFIQICMALSFAPG